MKYTGILKGVLKSVELRDLSSGPTKLNIIPTVNNLKPINTVIVSVEKKSVSSL